MKHSHFYNLITGVVFLLSGTLGLAQLPVFANETSKGALYFSFDEGDILEVRKYADQKIRINRDSIHRQAFNYIRLKVVKAETNQFVLSGRFQSRFRYDTDSDVPYEEEEDEKARFVIDRSGKYEVPPGQYMPNLRGIPTFPESVKDLKVGDSWTAPAEEIMKFKRLLSIPLIVEYEYRGSTTLNTPEGVRTLHKILMNYEISQTYRGHRDPELPRKVFGFATAIMFWDDSEHIPYFIQDEYNLVILFPGGDSREFNVKSKTFYKKTHPRKFPQKDLVNELQKSFNIEKGDKPDVVLRQDEIKINLPEVFFETNSAELTDKSKVILQKIIRILREKASGYQVIVRGYTDNRGSAEYNLRLSKKRAKAVADYIIEEGELPAENISYQGYGEKRPVASNATPEGRAKNRRVEIWLAP